MKSEKLLENLCLPYTSVTGSLPYFRSSSLPARLMQKKLPSTCPTKYRMSRYVSMHHFFQDVQLYQLHIHENLLTEICTLTDYMQKYCCHHEKQAMEYHYYFQSLLCVSFQMKFDHKYLKMIFLTLITVYHIIQGIFPKSLLYPPFALII